MSELPPSPLDPPMWLIYLCFFNKRTSHSLIEGLPTKKDRKNIVTIKPVLNGRYQKDRKFIFKTNYL